MGIFSTENIPFASRTSPTFAQNLVKLLTSRVKLLQKRGQFASEPIHVYELGAGNGILAKRILDLLKKQYPDIYKRIILHISDFSRPMISELKSSDIFEDHFKHLSFEVIDATKPKFGFKPFLVYFTNPIDSFPYRHILLKNGQIYEIKIQTSLKNSAQIIDTTIYPPKIAEGKDIANIISGTNTDRRLILGTQILNVLTEETKEVSADEANIPSVELGDLTILSELLKRDKPYTFNYSYTAREVIKKIMQELMEGGFLFFSDTGITSKNFEQDLDMKYGLIVAFPLDFLSLWQVANKEAAAVYITENSQGFPQEMLIDTIRNQEMAELFRRLPSQEPLDQINEFLKEAKTILISPSKKSQKSAKITALYNSLPKGLRWNYQLLSDLSFFLLQTGLYKQAIRYADKLAKNYGHSVGIYFYIVKGKAEQDLGNLAEAKQYFEKTSYSKYSNFQ